MRTRKTLSKYCFEHWPEGQQQNIWATEGCKLHNKNRLSNRKWREGDFQLFIQRVVCFTFKFFLRSTSGAVQHLVVLLAAAASPSSPRMDAFQPPSSHLVQGVGKMFAHRRAAHLPPSRQPPTRGFTVVEPGSHRNGAPGASLQGWTWIRILRSPYFARIKSLTVQEPFSLLFSPAARSQRTLWAIKLFWLIVASENCCKAPEWWTKVDVNILKRKETWKIRIRRSWTGWLANKSSSEGFTPCLS